VCGVNYREAKRPKWGELGRITRRQCRAPRPDTARLNQVSLWDLSRAKPRWLLLPLRPGP